jgi:hypothetical protein
MHVYIEILWGQISDLKRQVNWLLWNQRTVETGEAAVLPAD